VTIVLLDVNDVSPEFISPTKISTIENAPSNTVVMAIKAIDRDEGRNGYVEYSLENDSSLPFVLGPVDGLLRVSGPLDREQRSNYTLKVTAKDRGEPARSSIAAITVTVLDENDNSPVFDPRQYSATVAENASIGASVLQVGEGATRARRGRDERSVSRFGRSADRLIGAVAPVGVAGVGDGPRRGREWQGAVQRDDGGWEPGLYDLGGRWRDPSGEESQLRAQVALPSDHPRRGLRGGGRRSAARRHRSGHHHRSGYQRQRARLPGLALFGARYREHGATGWFRHTGDYRYRTIPTD